jgi:nonribosomal peptide synthetase DhbF
MTILEAIRRATERDPDRVAVVCGTERLSYRELAERSRSLAQHLVALGIEREQLVGVAIEPSLWAPVAMLAALEAGAAYVPLEPGYPRARLRDMIDQIDAPVILTTAASAAAIPESRAQVLAIDRGWPAASA